MKRILSAAAVCIALAACGGTPAASAPQPAAAARLIDVRTADEFAAGHLRGAAHIPHDQIGAKIAALAPDRDAEILLYCRSGRRSEAALNTLKQMGYRNVRNLGAYDDLKQQPSFRQPE